MEEGETVSILSRKELRKQMLMKYLAAKGKLKQPDPKPYLHNDCQVKKPAASARKVAMEKENKALTNKIPTLFFQSTSHPVRREFGVSNKVNEKHGILIARQNTHCPSATSGLAQPKLNPVFSNSSLNASNYLKKRPNTGMRPSGEASSNAAGAAVSKSHNRFNSSSKASWSCPTKAVSVRMSLGPIVKTKTGLIPAVTQPRINPKPSSTHTSATAADTTTSTASFVVNKMGSTTSSVFVSKKCGMAHRKTLPTTTARNHPAIKGTAVSMTARAGIKVQVPGKSDSNGLQSTSSSFKCTAPPNKSEGRVGMSKTNKSAGQPTDRSTKLRSENEGVKKCQQPRAASQTLLGPASRRSSRVVSGVTRAPVTELQEKSKKCKETDSKRGHSSANAPPPKTDTKKTGAPLMEQTVPQPARTISLTGQTTAKRPTKVPVRVIPQTEVKKLTAAQEERMRKLQEWREAKGISYKRPPMPVKPQVRRTIAVSQPFWATMKEEDDAHSLICAVDRSLVDCIKLLGEGCPPDQVKEVLSRLPAVSQKFAKYWICKARLMEQEGDLDVLPMFEKAVGVVLEPVDELRAVVFEILKKKDEIQAAEENEKEEEQIPAGESTPESINNPIVTPKPVRALICGERGDSSVVKYKITATPGGPQSQQKEPARVNGHEVRFFTPVRRSVRIERASLRYPMSLQDHDLCVASYNDLLLKEDKENSEEQEAGETSPPTDNTPLYVYRQNEALKDKVCIKLVCDEDV